MKIELEKLYTTIYCPDYGKLSLLSDLTFKAIAAYTKESKDSKTSFLSMLVAVVEEGTAGLDGLSDADIDCVASHYAKSLESAEKYKKAREKGKSPTEAFAVAFNSSSIWEQQQLAWKRMVHSAKNMRGIFNVSREAGRMYAGLIRSLQETFRKNSFMAQTAKSLSIRNSFMEQSIQNASIWPSLKKVCLQELLTQQSWNNFLAESGQIWQSQWLDMAKTARLPNSVFRSHQKAVTSLANRIDTIAAINRSTIRFRSQFFKMIELSQNIGQDMVKALEAFKATDLAIVRSAKIIIKANSFFASERGAQAIVPTLSISRTAENKELAEELEQGESSLSLAAIHSEESLHMGAAGTISLVNNMVTNLPSELEKIIDKKLAPYKHVLNRMEILADPPEFLNLLRQFAAHLAKDFAEIFWREPGKKFVINPEALAKSHLGIFLKGAHGCVAFVGPEIASGYCFVDLLVNFLGYDYLIELKMVGPGWGVGWAEAGLSQLNGYMKTYEHNESYLVIFDGRKTTRGKQLRDTYDMPNGRVHVVTVRIIPN